MADLEEKLSAILGNPDAMDRIMSIAQTLTGETSAGSDIPKEGGSSNLSQNPDSELVRRLTDGTSGSDSRTTVLLNALRPFLSEQRRSKIDEAIRVTKLTHMIRIAFSLLNQSRSEEEKNV